MFRRKSDGKIDALRAVPAFTTLGDVDLEQLAALADLVEVPDGTELMHEGGRGTEVYLIVEGAVRVTHDEAEVATLGPGDFVGEMALLDKGPRSATVTTVGSARVLVFDPRAFDRMVQSSGTLTKRLLGQISSRLRTADANAPLAAQ
jgi:CRP/FNR family transcriptional regulator, cyclic AMP receptor protein